ncbi:sugar ABC transporter ATP-binding protein [uncultured Brachyspira sp.]|uniref:sugar ABC transporter ATP-binding protein n=1 Tax=uncultured Brachyspira sp. TaxID=221953 RepID=UPI002588F7EB|nr:sugar ABC transporter ATP-binding protein [uncultured Brachyspira sp.]
MDKKLILKMEGITKSFSGIKALDNVNLDLYEGETLCLLGENGAGKSTLMKILSGVITPSKGNIYLYGNKINIKNPSIAHKMGISTVYQELIQFSDMNVMENLFIGRYPKKYGFVNFNALKRMTIKLMEELNIFISPTAYIRDLSIAKRQLIEIMKAVSFNSKIIIFDEPTSSLTLEESNILFDIIKRLKSKNISLIYISHRLEDIFYIGDRIIVLRDGANSGGGLVKYLDNDKVVSLMVGRDIKNQFPKLQAKLGDEILRVENIENEKVHKASFVLKRGEILGFGGLIGAGRSELIRAIMGLDECKGKIYKNGKEIFNRTPREAIRNKFALVPEDRKDQGLVLILSILKNIEMSSLNKLNKFGFMLESKERDNSKDYINMLKIKTYGYDQEVQDLSGGNQQKVVIAKCLLTKPDILILDEPTRGIDIGSKAEIYKIISDLANNGVSIIMISSDLPELLNMSDRIIIMREGHITGELSREEASEESVMKLATKKIV